jgi:hypothetical protein
MLRAKTAEVGKTFPSQSRNGTPKELLKTFDQPICGNIRDIINFFF